MAHFKGFRVGESDSDVVSMIWAQVYNSRSLIDAFEESEPKYIGLQPLRIDAFKNPKRLFRNNFDYHNSETPFVTICCMPVSHGMHLSVQYTVQYIITTDYNYNVHVYGSSPPLLTHLPSYLQRTVHRTPARLHLFFPLHVLRQPHCKRMAHATEASLRVVHSGCHVLPSVCQPQSLKSGISCWTEVAWLQ